jgi:hypothetical protein
MGVLWLRARAQLRGRARADLFLVLLVGLAGALVLAAAAGARRSEAALPRFLAANRTTDAAVFLPTTGPADDLAEARRRVAALPEVRQVFRESGRVGALVLAGAGSADPTRWHRQLGTIALDPGGAVFGRPIVVAGRLPDEGRAEEVAVDEELAERRGLRVGARYRVAAFTRDQLGPAGEGRSAAPLGAAADLLVVGVVRYPGDLVPVVTDQDSFLVDGGNLYLTPAWWRRYGSDVANYGIGLAVTLHEGQAGLPRLSASVRRMFGPGAGVETTQGWTGDDAVTTGTRRAIALESAALGAFALLAALAALLLVGQTLGRQIVTEAAESPTLRALGMTRGQLVGVAVVRAVPLAVAGAVLAVVGAVALSPATPLGVARRAELNPGVAVDLPVLAAGAVAVAVGVLACAALAGWRAGRDRGGGLDSAQVVGGGRRSRVAAALGAAGLPPAAVTGTRLALEPGRGRTAVPVRSAIAAAAAAVCALTIAVTFGASLVRLVGDPLAYGITWDLRVGNFADPQGSREAARKLAANPAVAAYAGDVMGAGSLVDGRSVPVLSFAPGKGSIGPAVVEGRAPARFDEVALGAATMRLLGKRVGDTVEVTGSGAPQRLRVVGRVVVSMGDARSALGPGTGAVAHVDLWSRPQASGGAPVVPISLWSASTRPSIGAGPSTGSGGSSPARWCSRSPSPTSPTWSGSATCPGCWPAWSGCWRWARSRTRWSPRSGGAAATWPSSRRSGSVAARCPRRWPGRRPPSRCWPWWPASRWAWPPAAGPGGWWPRSWGSSWGRSCRRCPCWSSPPARWSWPTWSRPAPGGPRRASAPPSPSAANRVSPLRPGPDAGGRRSAG